MFDVHTVKEKSLHTPLYVDTYTIWRLFPGDFYEIKKAL